ncbi:MAG: oligosaccharide flippase family protein [Thermoplasmata archaeon]|jgi:O-antigen/teichoic acid export membrane protein|nr:oligosaccharide flippase family protein [Thermoplasmatales archaeon]
MLGRKSLLLTFQNIITGIIGYVGLLFILRYSGLQPYGILTFSLSFVGLFSFILDMGFSSANIKRISEGMDFERAITTYFIIKVILAFIFVLIVIFSIEFWEVFLHGSFRTVYEKYDFYILIFYYIFQSFVGYYQSIFNAKTYAAIMSIPPFIEAVIRNGLLILSTVFILRYMQSPDQFSTVMAIIWVFSYAIYLIAFTPFARGWRFKRPTREDFKKYYTFAIPVSISAILGSLSANISIIIIESFFGSYYVGAYGSILKIVSYVTVISSSLGSLILPTLSFLHSNGREKEYRDTIVQYERYISLIVLPLIIFMIVFSKQVLNLWTSLLIPFSSTLIVLSIIVYINGINSSYGNHFNAIGNPKYLMYLGFISTSLIIVFDIILIPRNFFGINLFGLNVLGAAIASLISSTVVFFIVRVKVGRTLGVYVDRSLPRQILVSVITGFIIFYISSLGIFPLLQWWALAVWLIFIYIIFFILLFITKSLSKEDLNLIIEAVNPRKMIKYIIEEIKNK